MAQRYVGDANRLDDILRRLQSSLGPLGGEPVALTGGITNRNFRVTLGGSEYVVRVPGRDTALLGIDRADEQLAGETAARLAIAPEVVAGYDDCLVTRYVVCQPASSPLIADRVEEIARALRSFHHSGARLSTSFWVPDLLSRYAAIVEERRGTLPAVYADVRALAARIGAVVPLREPRPCHDDLLAGNIIRARDDGRMLIVDWEYAGMGHWCFDLGNLSQNNDFDDATDERLLRAYHGQAPTQGGLAALKLMRVLSDAREGAWGVVQALVSEIDFDFEQYWREHFERLQAAAATPRFQEWLTIAAEAGPEGKHGQTT